MQNTSQPRNNLEKVMHLLLTNDIVTSLDAAINHHIVDIRKPISDLINKHGWPINKKYVKKPGHNRYMEYSLPKQ